MSEPFPQQPKDGAAVRPEDGAQDDWTALVAEEADDPEDGNGDQR